MNLPALKRSLRLQRLSVYLLWLVIVVKACATLWLELSLTIWYPWNVIKALFCARHWLYTLGFFALQAPVASLHSTLVIVNETPPLSLPRDILEACSSLKTLAIKWMPLGLLQVLFTSPTEEVHVQVPSMLWQVWQTRPQLDIGHMFTVANSWQQVIKMVLLVAATILSGINFIPMFDYLYSNGRGEAKLSCAAAAAQLLSSKPLLMQIDLVASGGLNDVVFGFILAAISVLAMFGRYGPTMVAKNQLLNLIQNPVLCDYSKGIVLEYDESNKSYPAQLVAHMPLGDPHSCLHLHLHLTWHIWQTFEAQACHLQVRTLS